MFGVQSNFQTAEEIATKLHQGLDNGTQSLNNQVVTANQTTLSANEQAKLAHETSTTIYQQLFTAFQKDIENLKTVAKEFERMEETIKQEIDLPDYIRDATTYANAKR